MTTPHLAGHPAASQQAIVDATLLMLQQMGLSPGDLVTAPPGGRHSPCRIGRRSIACSEGPGGLRPGILGHAEPLHRALALAIAACPRSAPWG